MHKFTGLGVAIVTPFTNKGDIDYPSLKNLIDHQIQGGIDYLVVHGSTGEAATLTEKERSESLEYVKSFVQGRVPIVVGIGGNNTKASVDQIKKLDTKGIDGLLIAAPSYNKPTQEGIYQHFSQLLMASPLPVILYNVPGRTACNMTADTTLRLAEDFDNAVAIKEASGDLQQIMDIIQKKPKSFEVLSGDDPLTVGMIAMGAKGLISVIGNAYPKLTSQMVHTAMNGEYKVARDIHYMISDMIKLIFKEGNPAGIKTVTNLMELTSSVVRLPLLAATISLRDEIHNCMNQLQPTYH